MSNLDFEGVIGPGIVQWVNSATDKPVIWDRPNIPRPQVPYATLNKITPLMKPGLNDSITQVGDTTVYEISGQRAFVLSVKTYGEDYFDAEQDMILIQNSLENPLVLEELRAVGLAVWEIGPIQDISAMLETGYEYRTNMDITFGVASNYQVDLGRIETVEVEGTLDGETEPEQTIPNP